MIVNLDGEPIWSPIKDNDLKYAVNTNWDLFQHEPSSTYLPAQRCVLAQGDRRERAVVRRRGTLPDSFKKLPADENWKDVKASLPGKAIAAPAGAEGLRRATSRRN